MQEVRPARTSLAPIACRAETTVVHDPAQRSMPAIDRVVAAIERRGESRLAPGRRKRALLRVPAQRRVVTQHAPRAAPPATERAAQSRCAGIRPCSIGTSVAASSPGSVVLNAIETPGDSGAPSPSAMGSLRGRRRWRSRWSAGGERAVRSWVERRSASRAPVPPRRVRHPEPGTAAVTLRQERLAHPRHRGGCAHPEPVNAAIPSRPKQRSA